MTEFPPGSEKLALEVLGESDLDSDGVISFAEFTTLMVSMQQTR